MMSNVICILVCFPKSDHNTYVTVSAKAILNGTFSSTKKLIRSIEAAVVLLCWSLTMLDLKYNQYSYLASVL